MKKTALFVIALIIALDRNGGRAGMGWAEGMNNGKSKCRYG